MKSKTATLYVCTNCDAQSPRWTGQCLECDAWGTIVASAPAKTKTAAATVAPAKVTSFREIAADDARRMTTGIGEVDRVFGGGIVAGSVTLVGGEPGIGKSTLALALCDRLAAAGGKVIYVSGEESASQVKLRADRLGIRANNLFFADETAVEMIVAALEREKPSFVVIDSVQTLKSDDIPSEAGAVNQIRGALAKIVAYAKSSSTPVLLIGHVTKDGAVAGPKTLEHLVDAVLSFEGERSHGLRVLRALKNRFGSTDETGMFDMTGAGLVEIRNPSAYLLDARDSKIPGSAVTCILEGTRPLLVEIQALVQKTSFGYPARKAAGIDASRLEMLLAVLGRRAGMDFGQYDVYVNVVGGLKIREPAADLAVALALASAYRHAPLPERLVAWGEVGLGGEVRPVAGADRRLQESAALGMSRALAALPRNGIKKTPAGIAVTDVHSVKDALL